MNVIPQTVKLPSAFFHEIPDVRSAVTDEVLFGTRIVLCGECDKKGWAYAETSYHYKGYIKLNQLLETEETSETYDFYVVISSFCDVLPAPEYRYQPVLTLPKGSIVKRKKYIPRQNGKFLEIELDGKTYYVPAINLTKHNFNTPRGMSLLRENIVYVAMSYLGTPYRWGGKTPSGIDCSGLCFMAYELCGVPLWRDAVFDETYVCEIKKEELKPADLIYYKGHMVLYIGKGSYIHSSATLGGVVISSFDRSKQDYYEVLDGTQLFYARAKIFC